MCIRDRSKNTYFLHSLPRNNFKAVRRSRFSLTRQVIIRKSRWEEKSLLVYFISSRYWFLILSEPSIICCNDGTARRCYYSSGVYCDLYFHWEQLATEEVCIHRLIERSGRYELSVSNCPPFNLTCHLLDQYFFES